MSPKITSLTAAGLAALGITCAATPCVAGPQAPPAPLPPASSAQAAAPTPGAAPAPATEKPTVLLKSDGSILEGEITEDATGYYVKHRIGVKFLKRQQAIGAFRSIMEAYEYKVRNLAENDPDEQMKMARWCLEQKLNEQARTHVEAVLALSPDNARAKAMMFYFQSKSAGPAVDPEVARTGAEMVPEASAESAMPRPLNRTVLEELRSQPRVPGPPIIFDLPPQLAVKRYREYSLSVHPVLQNHCAKCHDVEVYGGDFRLVRTRSHRDNANDMVLRANLDATLRLVNPEDLARSELLTVAAMTHPLDGRPVLGGPNHPAYLVLRNWVAGIHDPAKDAPTANLAPVPGVAPVGSPSEPSGGFAVGRPGVGAPGVVHPEQPMTMGRPTAIPPRALAGSGGRHDLTGIGGQYVEGAHPTVPRDVQFPDPSRPRVMPPARPPAGAPNLGATAGTTPPAPGPDGIIRMEDGSQKIQLPNGEVVDFVSKETIRQTPPSDAPPAKPDGPTPPAGEKPKSKIKADALQQFLLNRSGPK